MSNDDPRYRVRIYRFSTEGVNETLNAELNLFDRKNYRPDHYIQNEYGVIVIYRKYQKTRGDKDTSRSGKYLHLMRCR